MDYVELLLRQNQLQHRITQRANTKMGTALAAKELRSVTLKLLAKLLDRQPTADELDQVCNW